MSQLIKNMCEVLATSFSFYLKLQFFHWNVEGPNFPQYHKLFGDLYEEVYDSIDKLAEEIRGLGGYAPGSLSKFKELSLIKDQIQVTSAQEMLVTAISDNLTLIKSLTETQNMAENFGEFALANYLHERIDAHKKHGWMLRATAKKD